MIDFKKTGIKMLIVGAATTLLMWFGTVLWNILGPVFGGLSPIVFLIAMVGLLFASMNIHPGVEDWGEIIPVIFIAAMAVGVMNMVGLPYPGLSFPVGMAAELKPLVTLGYAGSMAFLADTVVELMLKRR